MSSTRSPQEKKRLSLKRDRRNAYGENAKSSRKNIPRSKQRGHMKQRRAFAQTLRSIKGDVHDDGADLAEAVARTKSTLAKYRSFKKRPDIPLEEFWRSRAASQVTLPPSDRTPQEARTVP